MIPQHERDAMMRAHSIGSAMVCCLEEIGIRRLADLRDASAAELAMRIDIALGCRHINKNGLKALRNLVDLENAAEQGGPAGAAGQR